MTKPGLRERKKQKTRSAIQREAMRLFTEQGYDATTVEQIADAAEVSPSTFFRYFPTKEDVVLLDDYDPLLARMITERPADEPLLVAIRNGLVDGMRNAFAEDEQLVRDRVGFMLAVPAVRARMFEQTGAGQEIFCEAIGRRAGRDPKDFAVQLVAGAVFGALTVAVLRWATEPDTDLADLAEQALDLLANGLQL